MVAGIPRTLITGRGEPTRNLAAMKAMWHAHVRPDGLAPGSEPEAVLRDSFERFADTLRHQIWMRMFVQAVSAQLTKIATLAGTPNVIGTLLAGAAETEEARIADDLHRVAIGSISLDDFLAEHGYQGPNSGVPSALSWREDPRQLERVLSKLTSSEAPALRRARALAERDRVVAQVLAALPTHRRPGARVLLALAPRAAQGLESTKAAMLVGVDLGRAAIRTLGAELAAAGHVNDPEDAFFLYVDELLDARGTDLHDLVAARRERHERFLSTSLPETWTGMPEALPIPNEETTIEEQDVLSVVGVGASAGIAEGRVRIVLDAAADIDIDDGDVLVCPTTDPSWVSLMMLASALVIDMGAAVSHGAIVARELGVPCVIGTGVGTRALRDGDLVRVDGSTGLVAILERSPRPTETAVDE